MKYIIILFIFIYGCTKNISPKEKEENHVIIDGCACDGAFGDMFFTTSSNGGTYRKLFSTGVTNNKDSITTMSFAGLSTELIFTPDTTQVMRICAGEGQGCGEASDLTLFMNNDTLFFRHTKKCGHKWHQ